MKLGIFFSVGNCTCELCVEQKETRADAALHAACIRGDVQAVRFILDTGRVHVDCKDKVRVHRIGPIPSRGPTRRGQRSWPLSLIG